MVMVTGQERGVEVQQEGMVRVMRCWAGGEEREEPSQEEQRRRGRSHGSLNGPILSDHRHCGCRQATVGDMGK